MKSFKQFMGEETLSEARDYNDHIASLKGKAMYKQDSFGQPSKEYVGHCTGKVHDPAKNGKDYDRNMKRQNHPRHFQVKHEVTGEVKRVSEKEYTFGHGDYSHVRSGFDSY